MRALFFILLIVFFSSCTSSSNKKNASSGSRIAIYDSIIINESKVSALKYSKTINLYLAFNPNSKDILLINKHGIVINRFNKFGRGPEEYSIIRDFSFWNDSSIVILTGNILKRYDLNGNYIENIKLDNENPITFRKNISIYKDSLGDINIFYYADNLDLQSIKNIYDKNFYLKKLHFYNVNPSKDIQKRFISIEKESIYHNKNLYYSHHIPIYSLNRDKRTIDVNFPNEQRIFRYSIDNGFKLIKSIDLNADYFGKVIGTPWGKKPESGLSLMQKNSNYIKLFSFADTLVTFYFGGLPDETLQNSVESLNANISRIPKYIQLFINDRKAGTDIRLPETILQIIYIHSLNNIIFTKTANEYDELNNTTTFLIGKIEYEK